MGQFPSLRCVFNSACLLGSTFWTRDYTFFACYRPMAETIKDCSPVSKSHSWHPNCRLHPCLSIEKAEGHMCD